MNKQITILLITILLIGCSIQTQEEKEEICRNDCLSDGWQYGKWIGADFCNCYNDTIYINNTINKTIKIPCNITCPEYNKSRELELIRRISFLEGQQDKYFNDSECNWELNKTSNELEECQDYLCEYNSSWC